MLPNPYLMEKLARLRDDELKQRTRYAYYRLPGTARTFGERARVLITIGTIFSCGVLGMLLKF